MLIGTADVREWLKIPDGDKQPNPKLYTLCLAVQDFCDSFTHRKLEAARYNSDPQYTYLDGSGKRWIYVNQYPVSYVHEVNVDSDRDFGTGTQIALDDFFFYPDGKVVSEAGYFIRGRRNVKIDYTAGYAPLAGGTYDSSVSSYPLPYDLKQVMIEMVADSFKEGVTSIHSVSSAEETKFIRMLSGNTSWKMTLDRYKRIDMGLGVRDE